MANKRRSPRLRKKRQLSNDQILCILRCLRDLAAAPGEFRIYPPEIVTIAPEVLNSCDMIDMLIDTKWLLVFANGAERIVGLVELLGFGSNLAHVLEQFQGPMRPGDEVTFQFNDNPDLDRFMQPTVALELMEAFKPMMVME
jgi:hypothetical protein